jgi:hypothetical protein
MRSMVTLLSSSHSHSDDASFQFYRHAGGGQRILDVYDSVNVEVEASKSFHFTSDNSKIFCFENHEASRVGQLDDELVDIYAVGTAPCPHEVENLPLATLVFGSRRMSLLFPGENILHCYSPLGSVKSLICVKPTKFRYFQMFIQNVRAFILTRLLLILQVPLVPLPRQRKRLLAS